MELTKVSYDPTITARGHQRKMAFEALGWYIVLCLVAAITVLPFVWVLSTSLKGPSDPIVSVPPGLGYWGCRLIGWIVGDVVITREEIRGLMENRLYVDAPPLGTTKLSDWIIAHRDTLGSHYTSEMARRLDRVTGYRSN